MAMEIMGDHIENYVPAQNQVCPREISTMIIRPNAQFTMYNLPCHWCSSFSSSMHNVHRKICM